jgi:uncharacterized protein YoxC
MVTIRMTDFLLMILTGLACVAVVYLVFMIRKLTSVLDDLRRTTAKIDQVIPDIKTLCTTTEEAMRSVKGLSDQGTRVATDVAEVTGELREVAEDVMARYYGMIKAFDTVSMLVSSFKAGLAAVQALKCSDEQMSDPEGPSEETDDEEGNL